MGGLGEHFFQCQTRQRQDIFVITLIQEFAFCFKFGPEFCIGYLHPLVSGSRSRPGWSHLSILEAAPLLGLPLCLVPAPEPW